MKILVANDDGIHARGMQELVLALSAAGHEIYVCCPHMERSASGHGITIGKAVRIEDVEIDGATQAISMQGTPADCVKIGLSIYETRGIKCDIVVSGINHGGNIGTDTLYSGTVSAAVEGALCGLPAVAVSVMSQHPLQFDTACKLAVKACSLDLTSWTENVVLNINVPDLPDDEIQGVKVTSLGFRHYDEWFRAEETEDGSIGYKYGGQPVFNDCLTCDDNDVGATQHGYATVTPLQYDLTNHDLIAKVETYWNK
ncbi:MAG: 5'/3'-nucleotidase SurE [Clostridiales Family XIII bacterium]|jgi:5'-nucleotidase|nr:5'/3'-nucleotidase SurE [Clostridiales Family XIII bacterium]